MEKKKTTGIYLNIRHNGEDYTKIGGEQKKAAVRSGLSGIKSLGEHFEYTGDFIKALQGISCLEMGTFHLANIARRNFELTRKHRWGIAHFNPPLIHFLYGKSVNFRKRLHAFIK